MNQERLLKVLVAPVISEKSTMVAEKLNQACFVVVPDANKAEVKAAVELLFKVQVKSVQILNLKGKQKRFGRFMGCLLYTSPSPRDSTSSRMPSSA